VIVVHPELAPEPGHDYCAPPEPARPVTISVPEPPDATTMNTAEEMIGVTLASHVGALGGPEIDQCGALTFARARAFWVRDTCRSGSP
jgi:hypothetical protein